MKKTDEYKRKLALGYLIIGYTMLKELGPIATIVFERLVTEYNYVVRNKLELYYGYFGYEVEEIADSLGLTVEEASKALDSLEDKRLIERTELNGYKLIDVHTWGGTSFVEKAEKEHGYMNWDYNLQPIQYSAFKEFELNQENKEELKNKVTKYC